MKVIAKIAEKIQRKEEKGEAPYELFRTMLEELKKKKIEKEKER